MKPPQQRWRTLLEYALLLIGAVVFTIVVSFLLEDAIAEGLRSFSSNRILLLASMVVALASLGLLLTQTIAARRLPVSHRVAVIGPRRAGKTTLIITLFSEVFSRRIPDIDATLSGESTIERVNADIEKLQRGEALGPTTDQTTFAYRTNVRTNSNVSAIFPFPRTYKVEIGDFAGEKSEEFAEELRVGIHNTEYFKWTATADVFVFVIDLGWYALESARLELGFNAAISAFIRKTWMHLVETTELDERPARKRTVALVFTKTDIFEAVDTRKNIDVEIAGEDIRQLSPQERWRKAIFELGFGNSVRPIRELDKAKLREFEANVEHDFSDLIRYLEKEASRFSVIFTSSFGTVDGRRLGLSELVKWIFP